MGTTNIPGKFVSGQWSNDVLLDLTNSTPVTVPGAVEVASALSTYTPGAETAQTNYSFILQGSIVLGCIMNGNGLTVPGGATTPSYSFAAPAAGGTPGFGYDDNQPALCFYVNGRKHLLYGNALLMDPGAAVSYGLFADQSQATGISVTLSGAAVALKGVANQALAITATATALGGVGALATGATAGHVFIPSCAGTPTGTPSAIPTGKIALQYDSTNNRIYAFNAGTWRSILVV